MDETTSSTSTQSSALNASALQSGLQAQQELAAQQESLPLEGMEFFANERDVDEEADGEKAVASSDAPETQTEDRATEEIKANEETKVNEESRDDKDVKSSESLFIQPKDRHVRISLENVRDNISCKICHGVLRDAYTLRECIHSFCRICLLALIEEEEEAGSRPQCPRCETAIGFYPLEHIQPDPVLQALADKLVPALVVKDIELEVEFFESRGMEHDARSASSKLPRTSGNQTTDDVKVLTAAQRARAQREIPDIVKVLLVVHPHEKDKSFTEGGVSQFSIKTNPKVSIKQLRKYVGFRLQKKDYSDIEILFGDYLLGDEHTLTFVLKQHRIVANQLKLHYRRKG